VEQIRVFLEQQTEKSTEEISRLRLERDRVDGENEQLVTEVDRLRSDVDRLRSELTSTRSNIARLTEERDRAGLLHAKSTETLEAAAERVRKLEQEKSALAAERDRAGVLDKRSTEASKPPRSASAARARSPLAAERPRGPRQAMARLPAVAEEVSANRAGEIAPNERILIEERAFKLEQERRGRNRTRRSTGASPGEAAHASSNRNEHRG
jgi:hypothetical protein